jgi:hypothetical protein
MKTLQKILFMALIVVGFSMTAMAQRPDNNQNRPPKDPPTIPAPDKKPPEKPRDNNNNNNNNNRPKKPQDVIFVSGIKTEISSV